MSTTSQIPLEIWHIPTESDPHALAKLSSLLSSTEQQREQRTINIVDRNTFTTSHAALRIILGKHLSKSPQSLQFSPGQNNKPNLKESTRLHFNLSHTRDYSLLGVSSQDHIGIDIEIIKHTRDILGIAKRFFSATEYNWLIKTKGEQRIDCFYQLWCHKEAYLKALGIGLQGGLASFSLSKDHLVTTCSIDDGNKQNWWVQKLRVPTCYRAAVAVNNPDRYPLVRHWKNEYSR